MGVVTARYALEVHRMRVPAAGLLVAGAVAAHLPSSAGLPCPLRSLTGVPCPFCGLTTSVRAVFGGHLGAAAAAAPLGVLLVVTALLVVAGVGVRFGPRTVRPPLWLLAVALAAEWGFELARFHVLR